MPYGTKIKRPNNPGGFTSIWIDENDSGDTVPYHCWKCGTCVFQHGGDVSMMVPDYHKSKLPLVKMCPNRNCRRRSDLWRPDTRGCGHR